MRQGLNLGYVASYLFRGLFLTLFVAISSLFGPCKFAIAQKPWAITQTDNPLHITIVSEGYLLAFELDESGDTYEKNYYVRSGVLHTDSLGRLCVRAGKKVLLIDNLVGFSEGTAKVDITPLGKVRVREGDHEPRQIGELSVVHFLNPIGLMEIAPGVMAFEQANDPPPVLNSFGEKRGSYILQGWLATSLYEELQKPAKSKAKEKK